MHNRDASRKQQHRASAFTPRRASQQGHKTGPAAHPTAGSTHGTNSASRLASQCFSCTAAAGGVKKGSIWRANAHTLLSACMVQLPTSHGAVTNTCMPTCRAQHHQISLNVVGHLPHRHRPLAHRRRLHLLLDKRSLQPPVQQLPALTETVVLMLLCGPQTHAGNTTRQPRAAALTPAPAAAASR